MVGDGESDGGGLQAGGGDLPVCRERTAAVLLLVDEEQASRSSATSLSGKMELGFHGVCRSSGSDGFARSSAEELEDGTATNRG